MTDKRTLRKSCIARRNSFEPSELITRSQTIIMSLNQLECIKDAKCIMCYVSFGSEVFTHNCIEDWLRSGKKICVPYIAGSDSDQKSMLALEITDFNELSPGSYGILEPKFETCKIISPDDIDVIIIPGLAFDICKNRLGYGGGYYDRYITDVRNDCKRVAVCFDFQVVENIPAEMHDQRVDILVTDRRRVL